MAEIEHFVDPVDKSHPKFASVSHVELPLLSACNQMDGKPVMKMSIGEAVKSVSTPTPSVTLPAFCYIIVGANHALSGTNLFSIQDIRLIAERKDVIYVDNNVRYMITLLITGGLALSWSLLFYMY